MKINANELLLMNKKIRFGEEANKPESTETVSTQQTSPQTGMNGLMFQGINNVVSNPQLAGNLNILREESTKEEQPNNGQDSVAPLKTNVAFQGKASKFKTVAMSALMGLMTMGAVSTLQSCGEENTIQTVDVKVDMTAITAMLEEIKQWRQEAADRDKEMAAKYDQIISLFNQTISLLKQSQLDDATFRALMLANQQIMIDLMVKQGYTQEEANKKLDAIINSNMSIEEKLDAITNLVGAIKVSLDDIKASLERAEKDRAEFKEMLKENNSNVKELLEQGKVIIASDSARNAKLDNLATAIARLNIDMNSGIDNLANKLNMSTNQLIAVMKQLGYRQEQITKMTAAEILAAIKENTAETKKNGEIMLVGFNNLEGIIKDYGAKGEVFAKEVLNYIAAVGFEMNRNFGNLITEVKAGRVSLDEIKALIAAMNKNIEKNGETAKEDNDKILNYIAAVGYEMNRNFTAILNAINNGGKGTEKIEALLEKVLEKQDSNTKAIINAMGNIKVEGGKIDLSSIEAMLKDLLEQSKKNGKTLSSIDGKLNVIQITQQAILDKINAEAHKGDLRYERADAFMKEVLDKLGNQSGAGKYDDTKLLEVLKGLSNLIDNKTDKLLDAIKNHDVKVTVDVTGKVKCECNCGQNHEGILKDLENILE